MNFAYKKEITPTQQTGRFNIRSLVKLFCGKFYNCQTVKLDFTFQKVLKMKVS